MGGVNPYIDKVHAEKPTKPFRVTFVIQDTGEKKSILVDPKDLPYGRTGLEGSLMDIAFEAGIEVDHACGGVCACATCHVHVTEGLSTCNRANDDEEDQLDGARDLSTESRLSCQCVPNGTQDLLVVIPAWYKNFARD